MDENQTPEQAPLPATEAAAHPAAGAKKASTPNRLVAQVGSQMSALQQAETIKQLQGQVKQLETQTRDAGKVFLATTTTLITSAFALVAALAWNEAIQDLFKQVFSSNTTVSGLVNGGSITVGGPGWSLVIGAFTYAVLVTLVVVAIIYYLTRLNTRVGGRSLLGEAPKGKEG